MPFRKPVRRRLFHDTLGRLAKTIHRARRFQDLWRFLVCIVFYQAGIQAVISLAAIYAQQAMGFTTKETLTLLLVTNVTASVGALLFGQVQDRLGHKVTLTITLLCWIGTIVLVWAAQGPVMFWVAANLVGVCLGASQSAGRALVGYLSPEKHVAEFFGLWGLAVKLSAIVGPVTYGLVSWLSHGDHRLAMIMTGSFFIIGIVLLYTVDVRRGRDAALAYNHRMKAQHAQVCGPRTPRSQRGDVRHFLPDNRVLHLVLVPLHVVVKPLQQLAR